MVKLDFSDLNIEKLEVHHNIDDFDCGVKDLNEFLIEESYHQMERKYNVSYVCKYKSNLVAYFTWCNDSIKVKNLEDEHKEELIKKNLDYKYLPAIKLCRLAVDNEFKGNRIGPNLVELTIKNARNLSNRIGLRFITVDAYFQKKWVYEKYKFKIFRKEMWKIPKYTRNGRDDQTITMYKDIHKK